MSELLQEISRIIVFPIDFPSQQYTEKLATRILAFGTVVSCSIGFVTQSLATLVYCYGACCLLCLLLVLPSYPTYNKRRLKWAGTKIET